MNTFNGQVSQSLNAKIEYFASPESNLFSIIKAPIVSAEKTIYIMHSIFSDERIIKLLLEASERGVEVKVVINKNDAGPFSYCNDRFDVKIFTPCHTQNQLKLHQKFILIDSSIVLCGSVNLFKRSLEQDHESLLKIKSEEIYDIFFEEFSRIQFYFGSDVNQNSVPHMHIPANTTKDNYSKRKLIKKGLNLILLISFIINIIFLVKLFL